MSAGNEGGLRHASTRWVGLFAAIFAVGGGLVAWKYAAAQGSDGMPQAEPVEVVADAVALARDHRGTTTSIGTVLATRSIALRNEIPGTVQLVRLQPGQVVETGTVLVALDVSVEEAELKALRARADLAESTLQRLQRLAERRAISAIELDNARADRDVALAEMERIRAVIARKTIRAPFRARVGMADIHTGQFLDAGTLLTTLQGVGDAAHVDFAVSQSVALGLRAGDSVEVTVDGLRSEALTARVVAVDARIDPATRNAVVRARLADAGAVAPGSSARVRVPTGAPEPAVWVPVSALRKGPGGDHVFVLEAGPNGETRARTRLVRAGSVMGDEVVIVDGLHAGERVATSGSFKLRDGVLVSVASDAEQTP